ncbi:ARM repeat-containing protein [Panus rudis PR-1116 ss-1]|nr:ARM repeat-containing protein [Panus rudis PR-1116 ss-1]
MANVQAVLSALDVFSRAPDKTALDTANNWLQDFQHSSEAWTTCNVLLLNPDAPPAAKLFAAQTFRTKVTYDLNQVDTASRFALRDTLLTALEKYHAGPKTIMVQLCLAIAGLALQLPAWQNPVQDLIDSFGRNPATVPALLQFLTLLPEEMNSNTKIPVTDEEYKEREAALLTANAPKVLELLIMYLQAPGVSFAVQNQVFQCLSSWLAAGEITAMSLAQTPLLAFAFEALSSDELFDTAVAAVSDIIHETQEVEDNMPVIEQIVPRVIALKPKLALYKDDPEKIRGLARIFTEAGEMYRSLLLHHPETFFPIVEAIGECSAYPDLDIVPITFNFWMRLAQAIGKKQSVSPLFLDAYKALMNVIIRHLHFPQDMNTFTGQEADNFRQFRHVMGDTLKDCCYVLGSDLCLSATYDMITTALSRSDVSWQEIEAPLFAMRSMGAEVDPNDDRAVPKVMDLIPSLPTHPRVRYAALLIIARYTEWINKHPTYIQTQLQYISAGFQDSDPEVNAAAGQALKYLCQDCRQHLVDFLPQLHTFLGSMGNKLIQDDKVQVYHAIAYVISAMPMEQAAQSLRTFAWDILAQVHTFTAKPTPPTKEERQMIADTIENLEVMLGVIDTFGEELPAACQNACEEAWSIVEPFVAKHGDDYVLCERATRVIRLGLNFFSSAALPVVPSVLSRMIETFERTGFSSYVWIAGKIIGRFGNEQNPALRLGFKEALERVSNKVVQILQGQSPSQVPDVMEDYLQMILQTLDYAPDILFTSPALGVAFRAAMAALTLVQTDAVFAALEIIRSILTHDSLVPSPTQPPEYATFAANIRPVVEQEGLALCGYVTSGLTGDFPEETTAAVVAIFRPLAALWPNQLVSWMTAVLQQLPSTSVPDQAKSTFVSEMQRAISEKQHDKIKYAVIGLHRASLKARERRRMGPLDT